MNLSTTFGYEHENGKIYYIKTHFMTLDEIQPFLVLRKTPTHDNKPIVSNSINEYFNETSFIRVLYMLDGTTMCRIYGNEKDFIYF